MTRPAFALLALASVSLGCGLMGPKAAWELPPQPAIDAAVVQPGALTRASLPNGLRVIVLEDHRLPRVSIGVAVRRGAASVAPDRAGLAALTAEVMKRGAGERDALALARAVDAIGASLAVAAGWDSQTVGVSGLVRDLDRLVEILADVVLRPRLEAAEVKRAREEQLAGLAQAVDDPATLASWQTSKALYAGHRFGLPTEGSQETVAKLDVRDVRAFHAATFVPGNAVLFVSGDIRAEDFLARARQSFGDWPAADVPPPGSASPEPAPASRRIVVVDRPDLAQSRITLAHEGITRDDPERVSASLMNSVLGGGGFSSRLMASVRADEGLTYGVWSGFAMRRLRGPFVVATFTRVAETRRVIDLLIAQVEGMRTNPPSETELRDAQSLAVGRFSLSLETSQAVMASLVDLEIYGLPQDSLDTYRARVRGVTRADTAAAALRLLHPARTAIILVGPAAELVPQVEDLGVVEVVEP